METEYWGREPQNFLEEYSFHIKPKIQELDLFVKCHEGDFIVAEVSSLLELSPEEVRQIMDKEAIGQINTYTFFIIMEHGSSPICKLFRRELEAGAADSYEPEAIAYIYDIDLNVVQEAYDALGVGVVESGYLEGLFEILPPCCSNIYK